MPASVLVCIYACDKEQDFDGENGRDRWNVPHVTSVPMCLPRAKQEQIHIAFAGNKTVKYDCVPDFQGEFLEFYGYGRWKGCGEEVTSQA